MSQASTVPGVFVHAAAIDQVARGALTRAASPSVVAGLSGLGAAVGALAALLLAPWQAAAIVVTLLLAYGGAGVVALELQWWVPMALPLASLTLAPLAAYVVRYRMEERSRRRVQQELSFLSGLPRWMLERMAEGERETVFEPGSAEITVMFADLSGFTKMSTQVPPDVLAARCSQYLAVIVRQVEETGGWTNQFLGDSVMAIWGAPVPDPSHAVHALQAATQSVARIAAVRDECRQRGEPTFDVKVGINSGAAAVGRLGAAQRGIYTAAGETVNLAARLESVPALYACRVVLGPRTMELVAAEQLVRQLDTIRVKGIERALAIFEPLGARPGTPEEQARAARYAEALAQYQAGRFDVAARMWEDLASSGLEPSIVEDGRRAFHNPAAVMAHRARSFAAAPPQEPWSGVWELTGK